MIVMFKGLISEIPNKWQLCDGTNGTPDLRNKFVKQGAVGVKGGNANVTIGNANLPRHRHGGGYTNSGGNHRHTQIAANDYYTNSQYTPYRTSSGERDNVTAVSTSGGYHRHSLGPVQATGLVNPTSVPLDPNHVYLLFIKEVGK